MRAKGVSVISSIDGKVIVQGKYIKILPIRVF